MTVSVTHKFTSAKANGTDPTLVQPSNWNDTHNITCAGNSVLANSSGSTGAVTETAMGTLGKSILAANVVADLVAAGVPIYTTGDAKLTLKTVADSGWIMMNDQTIGSASSGANHANADAQSLYLLLWANVSNTYAPVTGGRGASALADWNANKPMQMLAVMGRALGVAGAGSGLTSRSLGQTVGEETHVLAVNEMPSHNHGVNDPGHVHTETNNSGGGGPAGGGGGVAAQQTVNTGSSTTGITLSNSGSGAAHNNMQPTTFLNVMVKL